MMQLKRIITFTKRLRKKLEIKKIRTKLENIIPSIWIEWWNWKPIKLLQRSQRKKLEIKRIKTKLENIIFDKLELKDEIKNK
jgi:hypothetical protein